MGIIICSDDSGEFAGHPADPVAERYRIPAVLRCRHQRESTARCGSRDALILSAVAAANIDAAAIGNDDHSRSYRRRLFRSARLCDNAHQRGVGFHTIFAVDLKRMLLLKGLYSAFGSGAEFTVYGKLSRACFAPDT